jgi:transposase
VPTPLATPIDLTERQRNGLVKLVGRQKSEKRLVTRAMIILAAADSMTNCQIADHLKIHLRTVRTWRNRWANATDRLRLIEEQISEEKSFASEITSLLMDLPRSGTSATFTAEQIVQIVAISLSPPEDNDRPICCWSHRELADEAVKRAIVCTISPRSVGRFLKSGGFETASEPVLAQSQNRR